MLNFAIAEAGEQEAYDTESEYSYGSIDSEEREEGNLWRHIGALDFGDAIFDQSKRVAFDRRFTHRPRYERDLKKTRRLTRATEGAETVTLYQLVHMLS